MFKILAVICFVDIGELQQDLCFRSEVPLQFDTVQHCANNMNNLADYLTLDLEERNVSIVFRCTEQNRINYDS